MKVKFVTLCILMFFLLLNSLCTAQNPTKIISVSLEDNIVYGRVVFTSVEYRIFQEIVKQYKAIVDTSDYSINKMMFTIREYFSYFEFRLFEQEDHVLVRNRIDKTDLEMEMKYSSYITTEQASHLDGTPWIDDIDEITKIPPRYVIRNMPVILLEVFDEVTLYVDQTGRDFIKASAEWHVKLVYNKQREFFEFLISKPWYEKAKTDSNGMEKIIPKEGYISIRFNMNLEIIDKVSEFE